MSATGREGRESSRELDRIVNFTDGVFAIVITLPVLDIGPSKPILLSRALGKGMIHA